MNSANSPQDTFKVLIVGAGIAALEAALALRDLGGERIATTKIAAKYLAPYLHEFDRVARRTR